MNTVNADLIKARISELQTQVDQVKSELEQLKESAKGNMKSEDVQKIDEYTRQLLTFKSGQAELIQLLQG